MLDAEADNPRNRRRTDSADPMARLVVVLAVIVGLLTVISTGVATYALVSLVGQQEQINANFQASQRQRVGITSAFCNAINGNALAANRETDYLRQLVIDGARQSRVFDDIYKAHGAPPYNERVAQAKEVARQLQGRKIPVLDCDGIRAQVSRYAK